MVAMSPPTRRDDVFRTYLYLRIGIVLAVTLLFVSIGIEARKAGCFQDSISAYYYTPVQAIFVGTLFAVGLALVAYVGEDLWEDFFLNLAGTSAPIVAVAPTLGAGQCWSVAPKAQALIEDGSLAAWVSANIDNNVLALLIVGFLSFLVAAAMTIRSPENRERFAELRQPERMKQIRQGSGLEAEERPLVMTLEMLGASLIVLILALVLFLSWDGIYTLAHGYAAVFFFACLTVAILFQARFKRRTGKVEWARRYRTIAILMVAVGVGFAVFDAGDHEIALLETFEIVLFALYWILQTFEKGKGDPHPSSPVSTETATL